MVINEGCVRMSRFNEENFYQIISAIETMDTPHDQGVAIGILEYMYDDDIGLIDQHFFEHNKKITELWKNLNKNFDT